MNSGALLKLRLSIGGLAAAVFVLTMGFNVLLSVSTLNRLAIESLLAGYRGAGEHMALSIERGLRFGKPLAQYAGMNEMLHDLRDGAGGIRRAAVLDAAGAALYTVPDDESGERAALGRGGHAGAHAARDDFDRHVLGGNATQTDTIFWAGPDSYRILIPLHHHGIAGAVALDVDKSRVDAATTGFARWAMALLAAAGVAVCVALAGWIGLMTATPEARARLEKSLSVLLMVLVGGTQLACSAGMLVLFQSFMEQAVRDKARLAAHFVQRDFEYIIHKGVDARTLTGGNELLGRIVAAHPELGGAALVTPGGTVLAEAGNIATDGDVVEQTIDAYWPSRFRQRAEVMRLRLHMNPDYVFAKARALGLDLATSLVVSLLFLMELGRLLGMLSTRMTQTLLQAGKTSPFASPGVVPALRAAGFLFFLGYDMVISFIPLLARKLEAPVWGVSKEVLAGLPISAEMVCAGVALLGAGLLSDRFGWRAVFLLGVGAAATGLLVGGASESLPALIAARGISGFGFGLALMASQIGTLQEKQAGSGLAGVYAGIFSGSICGSAAGALLAERVGFEPVFFVAASLVPFAILALILHGAEPAKGVAKTPSTTDENTGAAWVFLRDPRMHALLVMVGLPAALCLTGFLHYMLPLMLAEAQAAQSDIGRLFMLYGLCFITVGPILGRWLDHAREKGVFAMLTGFLSGASLLVAALASSLPVAALAVIIIGVAQCLAAPATMLCVVGLQSAERLGKGKTASIYRTLERVGQVLGPILFGVALVRFGVPPTLVAVGAGSCVLSILFLAVWRISTPRTRPDV